MRVASLSGEAPVSSSNTMPCCCFLTCRSQSAHLLKWSAWVYFPRWDIGGSHSGCSARLLAFWCCSLHIFCVQGFTPLLRLSSDSHLINEPEGCMASHYYLSFSDILQNFGGILKHEWQMNSSLSLCFEDTVLINRAFSIRSTLLETVWIFKALRSAFLLTHALFGMHVYFFFRT